MKIMLGVTVVMNLVFSLLFAEISNAELSLAKVLSVPQIPRNIYVPSGFDSDDQAMIVADGALPDTCYKLSAPQISVDTENKKITIANLAAYSGPEWCLFMLVPYTQVFPLGQLPAGSYSVTFETNQPQKPIESRSLIVSVAKPAYGTDEFLYAPVTSAYLETGNSPRLVIRGKTANTCLKWKEFNIKLTGNVLVVLPIMKIEGTNCKPALEAFERKIELTNIPRDKSILVHVRSLNGQAFNLISEAHY